MNIFVINSYQRFDKVLASSAKVNDAAERVDYSLVGCFVQNGVDGYVNARSSTAVTVTTRHTAT
jgi:hypothetical protein